MRIIAFIAAVVLGTLVTVGGIAILVLSSPERTQGLIWLPVLALTVLVYPPLLLGSVTSSWDVRASAGSRRYFRWWFVVSFALQALGAAAMVAFAVLAGAAVWLPVGYTAAAGLLDVLALQVGRALYRREEARRVVDAPWQPITRRSVVRRVCIVVGVFVGVLIVGSVGFVLLFSLRQVHHRGLGIGLLFAVEFACIAAALACIVVSLRLNRTIREQVSRDAAQLRKIAKVVLRGKSIPLEPDETTSAAKYAVLVSTSMPFTLSYLALLYAGMAVQQVEQLSLQPGEAYPRVFLAFLVVVLVVLLPLYVLRIRRARAYARAHVDELPAGPTGGETDAHPL